LKPSDARDYLPVLLSIGADPKGNLQKADELISQALVLDPNFANAHDEQARTFVFKQRFCPSIVRPVWRSRATLFNGDYGRKPATAELAVSGMAAFG
jgi:hypothetical protein